QAVRGFQLWFGVRPEVTAELRALIEADLLKKKWGITGSNGGYSPDCARRSLPEPDREDVHNVQVEYDASGACRRRHYPALRDHRFGANATHAHSRRDRKG